MSATQDFNNFSQGKSWRDKVLAADEIWAKFRALLATQSLSLQPTPRRPDVRMIVNNISGADITFHNPGDHSGSKDEVIPASGKSTAAMIMPVGATLAEQYHNAKFLYETYHLDRQGLSPEFIKDLTAGKLAALVSEAYGPAPFQTQSDKLVDVEWKLSDGASHVVIPEKGASASFGARAATDERVFLSKVQIFVKGTNTTPELIESDGINITVNFNSKTNTETTRPLAPSVARTYYGSHFDKIPEVTLNADGDIICIDLKNGTVIQAIPPSPASPDTSAPKP